jgi:hypothetical protein
MFRLKGSAFTLLIALLLATGDSRASAQSVTPDELQRMQDRVEVATTDITQLRSRDSALADRLQRDLDQVRDELGYLRVRLRRNEAVTRDDYYDIRHRLDDIDDRARYGDAPPDRASDDSARPLTGNEIPVGTEFDVRLQNSLSSSTARVEDRFEATTAEDLRRDDRVLVPAGSVLRGIVSAVTRATRIERKGALTLAFDRLTIDGRPYDIRATVVQALESEGVRGEAGKIGVGAGVGGIIGGLIGGVKGALAGILIGGGGTLAATEGKDVELPAGTVLRVRLDTPLDLTRQSFN